MKSQRSITRFGSLRSVFPLDSLHAHLVRLIVLSEDLKIELRGIQTESIEPLDLTGEGSIRQRYFLRRCVGTLLEFAEAFRLIDKCDGIEVVKSSFGDEASEVWDKTIDFFKSHEQLLRLVRNDLGGHFGTNAASYSLSTVNPGTVDKIELVYDHLTDTAMFHPHFVGEIIARAFVRHLDGETVEDRYRNLMKTTVEACGLAAMSVVALISGYVWDRFGR